MDLISVIPFNMILGTQATKLSRMSRMGQLYKIIRFTRMIRLVKVFKNRNKLAKNMTEILRMGIGFERFLYMIMIYILV